MPTDDESHPTLPAGSESSAEGVTSIGRFTIVGALGAGGMSTVLLAHDPQLDRRVAIKLLRPDVWSGQLATAGRDALLAEAQAMARLSHPNVVPIYEVGVEGDLAYLVMEQVEGRTLRAWLRARPRTIEEILETVLQAGQGLAAAHRAGVVHRDFKPENVLVGDDGRARIADFGLASGSSKMRGTPEYMAPEQAAGAPGGPAADQFAFCATLWETLEGERPPGTPRRGRAPAPLLELLSRGMAARPEDRWPSMDDLLAAIVVLTSPDKRYLGGLAGRCAYFYFSGPVTGPLWSQYLDDARRTYPRVLEGDVAMTIAVHGSRPDAMQRRAIGELIEELGGLSKYSHHAFITDSALSFGANTAINWVTRKKFVERSFLDARAGLAWLAEAQPIPAAEIAAMLRMTIAPRARWEPFFLALDEMARRVG